MRKVGRRASPDIAHPPGKCSVKACMSEISGEGAIGKPVAPRDKGRPVVVRLTGHCKRVEQEEMESGEDQGVYRFLVCIRLSDEVKDVDPYVGCRPCG